jgi:periplasmic protein CpxP/Spy
MMKKLILPAALAMALATAGVSAWAQMAPMGGGQGGGQMSRGPMSADQKLQMMTKQLNLTSDQQEKIKPILENESQQMQALHQDSSMAQEDRMGKMKTIRQSTND